MKYVIVNADQLADERQRWLREATAGAGDALRTARDTDRGKDEDVEGRPRSPCSRTAARCQGAWLAASVMSMTEPDAIGAVKSCAAAGLAALRSTDHRDRRCGERASGVAFSPGESDVRVTRIGDGDISVRVSSEGADFWC